MRDLIDTFGATILFQWREPLPMLRRERAIRRNRVENRIIEELGGEIRPFWSPPSLDRPGRVAVVHAAPHKSDVAEGELGNGVSAHRVRSALAAGGIAARAVTELACTWRVLDRQPTVDEVAAGHQVLIDAIDAADVNYVLLHGVHAMHCWRPDMTLGQMTGKVGLWKSRWWVVPIHHADSAFQFHASVSREQWHQSIQAFCDLVHHPDPFSLPERYCVARGKDTLCGTGAYAWDEDALPWCEAHWDKGRQGHLDTLNGPKRKDQLPGQLTMEI